MSFHNQACEVCGKTILKGEKAVKIEVGRKSSIPIGYWTTAGCGGGVAHLECLEVEDSSLREDIEVDRTQSVRKMFFKLADVELAERREE